MTLPLASPSNAPEAPGANTPAWVAPVTTGALVAVGTVYTGVVDPNHSHAFPFCPLRVLTGLDCPLCGCLRATHGLAHGNLLDAASHNLLFVLAVPYLAAFWVCWLLQSTGRPAPDLRLSRNAKIAVLVVAGLFTVARNLPFAGLHWLNSGTG